MASTRSRRLLRPLGALTLAALTFGVVTVGGCSCGNVVVRNDGGGDAPLSATEEVHAFCLAREGSVRSCTSECYAAIDEAGDTCAAESGALAAHTETPALLDCAMACAPGLSCPGRPHLVGCECADACLRGRSLELQELWRGYVRCLDGVIATDCYR